ncbi:hypothetical protein D3C81_752540 [compost metagenome]
MIVFAVCRSQMPSQIQRAEIFGLIVGVRIFPGAVPHLQHGKEGIELLVIRDELVEISGCRMVELGDEIIVGHDPGIVVLEILISAAILLAVDEVPRSEHIGMAPGGRGHFKGREDYEIAVFGVLMGQILG